MKLLEDDGAYVYFWIGESEGGYRMGVRAFPTPYGHGITVQPPGKAMPHNWTPGV